ncbi:MAG: hypothetical protein ACKVG9_06705 [Rhodospirillales bacterium]|jgi:hypothetical protein
MPKKLVKKPKEAENGYWKWDKKTLTQDDWDFDWLGEQKDKGKAVLVYECSREVIQLRELANDFRFKKEEWPFENQLPLEFFPDKPSRQIPSDVLDLMKGWSNSIPHLKTVDLQFIGELHDNGFLEKRTTHFQTFQLTQTKEIAAFEIDWKLGVGQIKDQFSEWVGVASKRFQKVKPQNTDDQDLDDFISRMSYEPVNQTRLRSDKGLKKLGAYRLQMAFESWKEAANQAFDTLLKNLYENQADWIEAKKSTPDTVSQYAVWP